MTPACPAASTSGAALTHVNECLAPHCCEPLLQDVTLQNIQIRSRRIIHREPMKHVASPASMPLTKIWG